MRFRYLKDPLFLFCVGLYFFNRWVLKPYLSNGFSANYLNDVICLPFWIPIMLFVMRKTGLRANDETPSAGELLIPLVLWSLIFEAWLPNVPWFKGRAFSDHNDVLCYAAGALFAAVFWRIHYRSSRRQEALMKPDGAS